MGEYVPREEFEQLVERVEELEGELETKQRFEDRGLDHRDATVLDQLVEGGEYHPRTIVKLYLSRTDIMNRNTAQNRARQLTSRPFFERRGGDLVFVGVSGDA